ncbi:MAG: hypothetical protein V3U75_02215 [Methylococcaceae bacterium]
MKNTKTSPAVDLVIVIDTSDSMGDKAEGLSKIAEKAIESTLTSCPSDLRVTWLGIEGTWKKTNFNCSVRNYLIDTCNVQESKIQGKKWDPSNVFGSQESQEDGAPTMEDIANLYDWRKGAQKAMFYLSDEPLKGGGKTVDQEDIDAANQAIDTANKAGMVIHTYLAEKEDTFTPELIQEYARVAEKTKGQAFTAKDSSAGFEAVLKKIICQTRQVAVKQSAVVTDEAAQQPVTRKIRSVGELSSGVKSSSTNNKKSSSNKKEPTVLIDLVLVADTDGSMKNEAHALSQSADNAINSVKKNHPDADINITWLGVSGTWKGTKVAQTFRDYLSKTVNVMESALLGKKTGDSKVAESQENGALAIANIATHFNWRPNAARILFYLSQQGFHGSDTKPLKGEIELTKDAIKEARQAGVIVHSYFGGSKGKFITDLQKEYAKLATETGGLAFNYQDAKEGFSTLFESVANASYEHGHQIALSYNTGSTNSTEEYAQVAEKVPSYQQVAATTGSSGLSLAKDENVINLEATIDRLQGEWLDARTSIRKLGLESGMGSFGVTSQGLTNLSLVANKEVSKTEFSVQWEDRYKDTQETYFAVQRLIAQAQTSIFEATQFVSIKTEANETISVGQNALSAWFKVVESSFSQYESKISMILEALNQAQIALAQIQPTREMGLAERNALWARVAQLEKQQNQYQQGDSDIKTSLLEVQKEKVTSQAEVSKLNIQITDLEDVIRQLKDSQTTLQATLTKAEKSEKDVNTERDTFILQVSELKTEASTYKSQYEALQAEIKRVEDLRAKVQAELTEWESKYAGAQKELNGLKIDLGKVSVLRGDQQESLLEPLKLQILQLQTERDNALSLEQNKIANLNTEIQGWKDRNKQEQEEKAGLREAMERLKLQQEAVSISAEGFEAERESMMAQISELKKTVTIRESNVDELQLELAKAVEAQKLLLTERGQWDERYSAALEEVQAKITRIQAASDVEAETIITETTTVKKSSGTQSSSASASMAGAASGSSASFSSSSKKGR